VLNIPVLRWGKPYTSLELEPVVHFSTGEEIASVSQANAGLIARDLNRVGEARRALESFSTAELVEISGRAAELFLNGELPLGTDSQARALSHEFRQPLE